MKSFVCFFVSSLHFAAAPHHNNDGYAENQGNQTLPTTEPDFVSDLSQGKARAAKQGGGAGWGC